jgi:hypothetical protein
MTDPVLTRLIELRNQHKGGDLRIFERLCTGIQQMRSWEFSDFQTRLRLAHLMKWTRAELADLGVEI